MDLAYRRYSVRYSILGSPSHKSGWDRCDHFFMIQRRSSVALIVANLIPVIGVLLYDWDVLSILLLYWTESVIIGVLNVARMLASDSGDVLQGVLALADRPIPDEVRNSMPKIGGSILKFILIPFFVVHYGMFCYGHLMAIVSIFGGGGISLRASTALFEYWQPTFWIAVVAVFGSHLYSFMANFIGEGEYKRANLMLLMHRPYGRIVAMHIAIVLGAGLVMWLGTPLPMLLILILVKTFLDMRLHEKERGKLSAAQLLEA